MNWILNFLFIQNILFTVGMAGKAYKLAAKTVWSERSQLIEKSERKLRKRSWNCSEPTDAKVRKQAPKVHGCNVNCRKCFFGFGLVWFRFISCCYFFLFVCLGKIKKMVLDIWRTKLLPRDYCGLKMGGNSNNKTREGESPTCACVPSSNLVLRVLTQEDPHSTSA